MQTVQGKYNHWLKSLESFPEYSKELEAIKDNPGEIEDRFFQDLNFGTAGLRGVMALGTNRMNFFTIGRATQGLTNYLLTHNKEPKIAIAYDSRNFSKEFAEHAASIFTANGCKVFLFKTLVPTPMLGFATKNLNCDCGVMITASHNPSQYNGYKVFTNKACQIDDDVAAAVFSAIQKIDVFNDVKKNDFKDDLNSGKISYIDESLINKYFDSVYSAALRPEICKNAHLRLTYTPLNGTGNLFVREMLKRLEVSDVHIVKEQELPDGNFPTCPYPNPEFKEALELGLKLAKETKSQLLIATDPDADRVAIAVADNNGEFIIFTGNQLATLLIDYIAKTRIELKNMPSNPVAVRSIVSSKLFDKVAQSYGIPVKSVLTGFKFIGEQMDILAENDRADDFVFGFEEACGFLIGSHVRDKDAIVACTLIVEMFSYYNIQNINVIDVLNDIYETHNYYSDMAQNLEFEGSDGMNQMAEIMKTLRENPPVEIAQQKIISTLDYYTLAKTENGVVSTLDNRPSNVLEYRMDDGCSVIIRPSGTEPKLKLYYALPGKSQAAVQELEIKYAKASEELAGIKAN